MGLGPFPLVSLAEARERAAAARREILDGCNPLQERRAKKAKHVITFQEAASQYVASNEMAWKNEKHRWQWRQTLETFAFPVVGDRPVASVDTAHVMRILEPIWLKKNETASRLRGRIEKVLDWARVRGFREGENPARWKGHLGSLLPRPSKVQKERHYPALPYVEVPAFMRLLREQDGVTALALRFQILTATRSGEVRGASWAEIDLQAGIWSIPAHRMKTGSEHRVPLSEAALEILRGMKPTSAFVFANSRGGQISDMAATMAIRRMHERETEADRKGFIDARTEEIAVPHGFRSSFKDWATETTSFPNEVSEMALAHGVENKVEAAYRRGDLFEKRRGLMEAWAAYLDSCGTPLRGGTGRHRLRCHKSPVTIYTASRLPEPCDHNVTNVSFVTLVTLTPSAMPDISSCRRHEGEAGCAAQSRAFFESQVQP